VRRVCRLAVRHTPTRVRSKSASRRCSLFGRRRRLSVSRADRPPSNARVASGATALREAKRWPSPRTERLRVEPAPRRRTRRRQRRRRMRRRRRRCRRRRGRRTRPLRSRRLPGVRTPARRMCCARSSDPPWRRS
jgi:hypothetical protein